LFISKLFRIVLVGFQTLSSISPVKNTPKAIIIEAIIFLICIFLLLGLTGLPSF